jgi:hypothetical protein
MFVYLDSAMVARLIRIQCRIVAGGQNSPLP